MPPKLPYAIQSLVLFVPSQVADQLFDEENSEEATARMAPAPTVGQKPTRATLETIQAVSASGDREDGDADGEEHGVSSQSTSDHSAGGDREEPEGGEPGQEDDLGEERGDADQNGSDDRSAETAVERDQAESGNANMMRSVLTMSRMIMVMFVLCIQYPECSRVSIPIA